LLLALCRLGGVLTVMWLLSKPALVVSRNRVYPSVVAVAVDQSASMSLSERAAGGQPRREKRWDAARQVLTGPDGLLARLSPRQQVALYTFADTPRPIATIASPEELGPALEKLGEVAPDGSRTALAGTLQQILDRSRGSRLAAVVFVTDGRQTVPTPLEPSVAEAQNQQVAVSSV